MCAWRVLNDARSISLDNKYQVMIMNSSSNADDRLLRLINAEPDSPDMPGNGRGSPVDRRAGAGELLDAYSRAVIHVVEDTVPAVIGVSTPRGSRSGGSGSGFLITPDGYALTNSHVVGGRNKMSATTPDGDLLDGELIGDDPATDLALLRLAAGGLPFVRLGDSDALRVGQLVIAMGDPLGLQSTVSTGIVSALGRSMRGRDGRLIESIVQHSAPLNPGNSGGPLLDSRGLVVAVNTAIIPMGQGLGFAVPGNTARWVIGEMIAHGRVRRAHLGVAATVVPLSRQLARELDLVSDRGVEVVSVQPNGPRVVTSVDDVHRLLSVYPNDQRVTLKLVRDARLLEMDVVVQLSS
jgi:S1-C subfamily serine protease